MRALSANSCKLLAVTMSTFVGFNFDIESATREIRFSFFEERKVFAVIAKVEFEPNTKDETEKKDA